MGRIKAQAKSEIKGIEHPQMAQMAQMKRQEARGKRQEAKAKPLDRGLHLATMMTQTTTTDKRQHLWIAAYSTPQ